MLPQKNPEFFPSQAIFTQRFNHGISQLVWTVCPGDLDTPVSAMLRLQDEHSPSFLLESVEKGEIRGRYSIIGLQPDIIWRCKGNKAEMYYNDVVDDAHRIPCEEGSMASLRKLYDMSKIDIPPGLPPMASGLIGYM